MYKQSIKHYKSLINSKFNNIFLFLTLIMKINIFNMTFNIGNQHHLRLKNNKVYSFIINNLNDK